MNPEPIRRDGSRRRLRGSKSAGRVNKGQLIGEDDLIIAATARCHDLSVLTDNVQEFSRVPGLRVIPFVP